MMRKPVCCNPCVREAVVDSITVHFSESLYGRLLERIGGLSVGVADPVAFAKQGLKLVNQAIEELTDYQGSHPFVSEQERERFLGLLWPKFKGLQFYYTELLCMEYNKPVGDNYELMHFYKKEIEFIRHFFYRHSARYQQYRIKTLELDGEDLPLGYELKWALFAELAEDSLSGFSLNAQFYGYEQLLKEALVRLAGCEQSEALAPRNLTGGRLKWTGKITNLVELAYGLFETEQINNGKVSISDVLRWLEQSFQVDLQFAFGVYEDIKGRKRMSPAHFLEQMRIAFLCRVESELGYEPGKY